MTILAKVPWLRRFWRRRLRRALRGAIRLTAANQLGRIPAAKSALTSIRIGECDGRVSRFVLGAAYGDAERALRQYLLVRVGGQSLNNALLRALGTADG